MLVKSFEISGSGARRPADKCFELKRTYENIPHNDSESICGNFINIWAVRRAAPLTLSPTCHGSIHPPSSSRSPARESLLVKYYSYGVSPPKSEKNSAQRSRILPYPGWGSGVILLAPSTSHGPSLLGRADRAASPVHQGIPGWCDRGKPPSRAIPGLPPVPSRAPCHQYWLGRMIARANAFPRHPSLPGTHPGGPTNQISLIYLICLT
jgi:hypothetical protein